MTKEAELMQFLHERVFDPVLASEEASAKIKKGVNLTIARMSRLNAKKMVQYFWSALSNDNSIEFSKLKKAEGLPRFEDVFEEFRERFNKDWILG